MKLAVPKESNPQETRVAISPETAKKFRALNLEVAVERGAGEGAGVADVAYENITPSRSPHNALHSPSLAIS